MQFLNDGTAKAGFVNEAADNNLILDGSHTYLPIITSGYPTTYAPTQVLNDADISTSEGSNDDNYGSGTDIYFKLGTVTNSGTNSGKEYVVIEFNALVLNEAGVQALNNADGTADPTTTLSNTFDVFLNDDFNKAVASSSARDVDMVEPYVTIDSSVTTTPSDAGDIIEYSIEVENSGGTSAFNLEITDILPVDLDLVNVVQTTSASGVHFSLNDPGDDEFKMTVDDLAVGVDNKLIFKVTAKVEHTAEAGQTIDNTANVT